MTIKPNLKGSKNARLSMARLAAVQCVYQWLQAGATPKDILAYYDDFFAGMQIGDEQLLPPDRELLVRIVSGVQKRSDDLSPMILAHIQNAEKEKEMSKDLLLLSILYCGSYEIFAHHETDTALIIGEYLNVTKAFYEGHETKLINGTLDAIAKLIRA